MYSNHDFKDAIEVAALLNSYLLQLTIFLILILLIELIYVLFIKLKFHFLNGKQHENISILILYYNSDNGC